MDLPRFAEAKIVHNATLDHARLGAAFGIVLFHSGAPGAAIGYAALPFFLIVMLMLGAPGAARLTFSAYATGRARRLLLPWLIWSGAYGLLKLTDALVNGAALSTEFAPWMLLTGPALHLWFLPFAFAACLMLYPLARIGTPRGRGLALALCGLAALAAQGLNQGGALPPPLAEWRFALPAVCFGFGFALAAGRPGFGAVLAVAGAALGLAALSLGWTEGLEQLALALVLLAICRALPRPATALSDRAAQCALGVYLAHPLVMALLLRATPLPEASLALAAATALGALGLTLALHAAPALWQRRNRVHPAALSVN